MINQATNDYSRAIMSYHNDLHLEKSLRGRQQLEHATRSTTSPSHDHQDSSRKQSIAHATRDDACPACPRQEFNARIRRGKKTLAWGITAKIGIEGPDFNQASHSRQHMVVSATQNQRRVATSKAIESNTTRHNMNLLSESGERGDDTRFMDPRTPTPVYDYRSDPTTLR